MSKFLLIGVALALVVPLLSRGNYARLVLMQWRWRSLLALGVVAQLLAGWSALSWSLGFGLLVASYVLLIGFCAGNVIHRGMAVITIGIAVNFASILLNSGMPVHVPPDWEARGGIATTVKHHPQDSRDRVPGLGDVIVLRALDEAISFGDLILVVGLCDLTFQASRRRRGGRAERRRAPRALRLPMPARLGAPRPRVAPTTIDLTSDERVPALVNGGRHPGGEPTDEATDGPGDGPMERVEHA